MDGIKEPVSLNHDTAELEAKVRRLTTENAYLQRRLEQSQRLCEKTAEAYNELLAGVAKNIERDARGSA